MAIGAWLLVSQTTMTRANLPSVVAVCSVAAAVVFIAAVSAIAAVVVDAVTDGDVVSSVAFGDDVVSVAAVVSSEQCQLFEFNKTFKFCHSTFCRNVKTEVRQ